MDAGITEVAFIDSRGSRVGMFSKIYCPVLETRHGGGEATDCCPRQRKRNDLGRESEGFIVPFETEGQQREAYPWGITLVEGRDPTLFM